MQSAETVRALGFTRVRTPTVSTLREVFNILVVTAFEAALAGWAQAAFAPNSQAIALDGKALRGIHGNELPGVRSVAAYDVETGLVPTQAGAGPACRARRRLATWGNPSSSRSSRRMWRIKPS